MMTKKKQGTVKGQKKMLVELEKKTKFREKSRSSRRTKNEGRRGGREQLKKTCGGTCRGTPCIHGLDRQGYGGE